MLARKTSPKLCITGHIRSVSAQSVRNVRIIPMMRCPRVKKNEYINWRYASFRIPLRYSTRSNYSRKLPVSLLSTMILYWDRRVQPGHPPGHDFQQHHFPWHRSLFQKSHAAPSQQWALWISHSCWQGREMVSMISSTLVQVFDKISKIIPMSISSFVFIFCSPIAILSANYQYLII